MKNTGIIRRIDELGRIVIPKEIRRSLGIRDGELLEINVNDNYIYLKKYQIIENINNYATKLVNIFSSVNNNSIIITNREKVIAISDDLKEVQNKKISKKLLDLIDKRETYESKIIDSVFFEEESISGYFIVSPIISNIDSIGLVIMVKTSIINDNDKNIIKIITKLLNEKLNIS